MKPETFTFTKEVACADADGEPIREGSVLRHIEDNDRGVVMRISRVGMQSVSPIDQVGDIHIQTSPGCHRCTNNYFKWRHIPHNEQTYEERFLSWLHRPYEHDSEKSVSKDEGAAIDGIMALLPDDVVDWDYGPFPDRLEDALRFLMQHLSNKHKNDNK